MLPLPITDFFSTLDKVFGFLKDRQIRRRDYFDKVIDPLYAQFSVVGEDYLKVFREARTALEKVGKKASQKDKFKLLETMQNRREEFLTSRLKVRGIVNAFRPHAEKEKDKELLSLLEAMDRFFYGSGTMKGGSVGYQLVDVFSIWARPDEEKELGYPDRVLGINHLRISEKGVPVWLISAATEELEKAWFETAGRYASLRMKYLGNKIL